MRANWFVGIPVTGAWMTPERVPAPPPGTRLFHPEDLHLTIAFLGACGEERARRGWEALAWPLASPVRVTLGAVVPMGPEHRYSALSATLIEGRESIEGAISASRGAVCEAAEVAADTRAPKAHVTLARPGRRAGDRERHDAIAWAAGVRLEDVALELDELALYTWSEDRAVRLFRTIDRRAFGAAGRTGPTSGSPAP